MDVRGSGADRSERAAMCAFGTTDEQLPHVTLIPGDGIGPEISKAVKDIFAAANVCDRGLDHPHFIAEHGR